MVKAVLFDLGDTIIHERVDDVSTLDQMHLETQPYARETLEALSRKVKLALVTDTNSSVEPVVRRALRRLGIESFFTTVITSQDLKVEKPSPKMFQEALRQLDVQAKDAVMVGNDIDRDIVGARQVGMHTVLFTSSSYYDPSRADLADYTIHSLSEVPFVLADIDRRLDGGPSET